MIKMAPIVSSTWSPSPDSVQPQKRERHLPVPLALKFLPPCFLGLILAHHFGATHRRNERSCRYGSAHLSCQRCPKRQRLAIKGDGGVPVLIDLGAVQSDASKGSLGSRVRK